MVKRSPDSSLTTTTQVMEALGGIAGVSALTGSPYGATENWRRARTFPARYFLVMFWALHNKGLTAPPELWRQVTPEQRKRALEAAIAGQQRRVEAA